MSSIGLDSAHAHFEPMSRAIVPTRAERRSAIRNRQEWALTAVEIAADWLLVSLALHLAYGVSQIMLSGRRGSSSLEALALVSVAVPTLVVLLLENAGTYSSVGSLLWIKETARTLWASVLALVLILLFTFLVDSPLSRWLFIFALPAAALLQAVEKQCLRFLARALHKRGIGVQNVLIYGSGPSGSRIFSALVRSPRLGLNPVAVVDDDLQMQHQTIRSDCYRRTHSVEVARGPLSQELIERYACEWLVIATSNLDQDRFRGALQLSRAAGCRFAYVGQSMSSFEDHERVDIDGVLLNLVAPPGKKLTNQIAKRTFDFFVALVLLVLLSPLFVALALCIWIDSKGPVLFCQQRAGKGGELFDIYKFRSMCQNAPKYRLSPTASSDKDITRFGRLMRRCSADELPQLINVVKGEMSLVGPRPEMPTIAESYDALQRRRLEVTPGMTGLWQISADRGAPIHENMQYDLYYIQNCSFFLDLAILLHTPGSLMRGI